MILWGLEQGPREEQIRRADAHGNAEKRLDAIAEHGAPADQHRRLPGAPYKAHRRGPQCAEPAEQCKKTLLRPDVQIFIVRRVDRAAQRAPRGRVIALKIRVDLAAERVRPAAEPWPRADRLPDVLPDVDPSGAERSLRVPVQQRVRFAEDPRQPRQAINAGQRQQERAANGVCGDLPCPPLRQRERERQQEAPREAEQPGGHIHPDQHRDP